MKSYTQMLINDSIIRVPEKINKLILMVNCRIKETGGSFLRYSN